MNDYVLSCCSTADLDAKHFQDRNISYICFHFFLDGKEYADDLGKSISFPDFYQAMKDGADTRTSQINQEEYAAYFTPFLEQGKDLIHVCLSSGISGAYNSARLAAEELTQKFPDRKIYVVDSLAASSGFGLLMDALADQRDAGLTIDELHAWVLAHRNEMHHWFFSTDLTFFVKGGRVSKTSGFLGNMLHICPLLNVSQEGKLIPREKIRTKKRAIARIVDVMKENARDGLDYNGKCYMCHSACYEDARAVADLVEAQFKNLNGKVLINNIGTTIGSHTGPGTVALFYWGKPRVD